jgi:intraflagellar transport protein 80
MKLEIARSDQKQHTDIVSCVGWASNTTLYSVSDDHRIMKWTVNSEDVQKVLELPVDTYITDLHWYPVKSSSRKGSSGAADLCALATTNGRFALMTSSGKIEKTTEGHTGAILKMRWSHDGTALATAGEDGGVKVWSKTGMLRSTLAQLGAPVYSLSWSPDSDQLLHTNGRNLVIKPLQPSVKPNQWKAHDGVILTVDWSQRNNTIVSGGEDKRYKVWDCFGRILFTSQLHDSPIASLAWSPDGSLFAVGAFNMLRLCDKTGWSYSMEKSSVGTVMNLSWTSDGTQVAAACGGGDVVFASIVDRKLEWRNLEVTINGDCTVDVLNIENESKEHLEFSNSIVKASLSWGHLIVITATQMYIFNCNSWGTPVTVDLKNTSVFIIEQTERFFLLVDSATGVQVYSYEGRQVSVIKHASVIPEALNTQNVSISNDTVAIRDRKDERGTYVWAYVRVYVNVLLYMGFDSDY